MAETVYVFGAGINRSVRDLQGLKPPLANDLFKQVLRHETLGDLSITELPKLFEYIERYWKLSIEDLREEPFDLEACYTLLQQQRLEFKTEGNEEREEEVAQIEDQLTVLFTKFLAFIEGVSAADPALRGIANKILAERAAVLTFNYDTIIESAIEYVVGRTENPPELEGGRVPDEHLSYSYYNWNRARAYGVRFDEVHLQHFRTDLEPVEGERFYSASENALYPAPILKLHGSLNWFRHTSRRTHPDPFRRSENPNEGNVVLANGYPHIRSSFGPWEDPKGWVLEPVIVTPVLYKDLAGDGHRDRPAVPRESFPTLTDREREMLHLMMKGASNADISRLLSLSPKTVANYVSSILHKLQVADRTGAIVRAREVGLGNGA